MVRDSLQENARKSNPNARGAWETVWEGDNV
jgi:hypothetical protein